MQAYRVSVVFITLAIHEVVVVVIVVAVFVAVVAVFVAFVAVVVGASVVVRSRGSRKMRLEKTIVSSAE